METTSLFQILRNLSADLQQRDLAKFGVIFCGEDAFFCIQQTLLCFTYLKTGKVSLYITIHGNIVIVFGSYEVLTFQIQ